MASSFLRYFQKVAILLTNWQWKVAAYEIEDRQTAIPLSIKLARHVVNNSMEKTAASEMINIFQPSVLGQPAAFL